MKAKFLAMMMLATCGLGAMAANTPVIVSSQIRANDPTILDVVYKVVSDKPTVNVRALAFQDGERSFLKVVRPETFVKDASGNETAQNIGDNIAANVEHRLSWKVSSDWATDLAKVKFEILSSDQGKLPLDLIEIPATAKTPKLTVSYNSQTAANVFNALMWYYANGEKDLRIDNGLLYNNNDNLSTATTVAHMGFAVDYVLGKMGYKGLDGEILGFARSATRKSLSFNTGVHHSYRKGDLSGNMYVGEKAYCVIDVSGGTSASSYPVTYLDSCPVAGWSDDYKTTKILLRRIEPGEVMLVGIKPVTLTKAFYMGVFEVTQKQYQLVTGKNPSSYKGDMRPVENVSWNDVRGDSATHDWPNVKTVSTSSFIGLLRSKTGLDFDLPTESQWEYACRAGTTSYYNNGGSSNNDCKQLGRSNDNRADGRGGYAEHTAVGSYAPNVCGLYDMHGNVYELCLDWYGNLNGDPFVDWLGASSGSSRVLRGGGWSGNVGHALSSSRYGSTPSGDSYYNGFRLACSAGL